MAASLGETLGFAGLAIMLIGLLVAVARQHASRAATPWPGLVIAGLTGWLALQTLIHLSVCTNLLPVTGLTLPLLSYGGSWLCAPCWSLGLLLGLAAASPAPEPPPSSGTAAR